MALRPEHALRPRAVRALCTALIFLLAAGLFGLDRPGSPGAGPVAAASAASDADPGDAMASQADRRYQAARRSKRVERLWIVAAAVYVPPFILLVFGWAVAGIVRRFRAVWQH